MHWRMNFRIWTTKIFWAWSDFIWKDRKLQDLDQWRLCYIFAKTSSPSILERVTTSTKGNFYTAVLCGHFWLHKSRRTTSSTKCSERDSRVLLGSLAGYLIHAKVYFTADVAYILRELINSLHQTFVVIEANTIGKT